MKKATRKIYYSIETGKVFYIRPTRQSEICFDLDIVNFASASYSHFLFDALSDIDPITSPFKVLYEY